MSRKFDGDLIIEGESLGMPQFVMASLCGFSSTVLSLAKTKGRPLSPKHRARLETILLKAKRTKAKHPGVELDMKNEDFLRKEFAKEEEGEQDVIAQTWSRDFGIHWAEQFGFRREEPFAAAQMDPRTLRATIWSQPAQRWFRAYTAAMEVVLAGQSFNEYVEKFPDRHSALTAVANTAFANLLAKVGKAKVLEYLSALVVTGEIKQSSTDQN